jgi:hypothetical protein
MRARKGLDAVSRPLTSGGDGWCSLLVYLVCALRLLCTPGVLVCGVCGLCQVSVYVHGCLSLSLFFSGQHNGLPSIHGQSERRA